MCVFPEKTPKLLDNWLAWIGQLLLHFVELYLSDYLKKMKIEKEEFSRPQSRPICKKGQRGVTS